MLGDTSAEAAAILLPLSTPEEAAYHAYRA